MIELVNVSKVYEDQTVLKSVSMKINKGDMVSIIGPSGSGKSTLLSILAGYEYFEQGSYYFRKKKIYPNSNGKVIRNEIGMIFQDYMLLEDLSVVDNILMGCHYLKKKNRKRMDEIVEKLNIQSIINKKVSKLSGGEKQRVAIARILYGDKNIILADEPTGALDKNNAMKLMEVLKKLNNEGKTIIIVTHDLEVANQCKNIIRLQNGSVV